MAGGKVVKNTVGAARLIYDKYDTFVPIWGFSQQLTQEMMSTPAGVRKTIYKDDVVWLQRDSRGTWLAVRKPGGWETLGVFFAPNVSGKQVRQLLEKHGYVVEE